MSLLLCLPPSKRCFCRSVCLLSDVTDGADLKFDTTLESFFYHNSLEALKICCKSLNLLSKLKCFFTLSTVNVGENVHFVLGLFKHWKCLLYKLIEIASSWFRFTKGFIGKICLRKGEKIHKESKALVVRFFLNILSKKIIAF